MKFLLDTNVFRELGKTDCHEFVAAWLRRVDDGDLAISTLTVREVSRGIARLRGNKPEVAAAIEKRVDDAYAAFGDRILPVSAEVARVWGGLLAENQKHTDDTGLAATARVHGLVLVTRNLGHVSGRSVAALDPYAAKFRIVGP